MIKKKCDLCNLVLMVLVLGLGICFRSLGLNWDQGHHLHPDERFLTMVMTDMKLPSSWGEYVDPKTSTLNPTNIGHSFFVYGTAPLILNKLVALVLGNDTYGGLSLQGRTLSVLADGVTIILVFLIARLLRQKYKLGRDLPFWAAFIYSVSVLPIQLAHFFTVDSLLILFSTLSIWGGLKYAITGRAGWVVVAGAGLGLAISSKISALIVLPLLLLIGLAKLIENFDGKKVWNRLVGGLMGLSGLLLTAYLMIRVAGPYIFADPEIWSLRLNPDFMTSLKLLQAFNNGEVWYPPAIQWIGTTPVWFALKNMALLGLGLPVFGSMLLGMVVVVRSVVKGREWLLLALLLWWLGYFGYQSVQFVKALRYFSMLYPVSALLAGLGVSWSLNVIGKLYLKKMAWVYVILVLIILIWPLAFMSVYVRPHTRVTASEWIYENVEPGSKVVNELWDDPLPLLLPKYAGVKIQGEMMSVFDQDTDDKWVRMNEMLQSADYYFLTSNRAWGSISKVPEKYPQMSRFYEQLLNDELEFKKVAEFTSYPSLRYLGIPIDLPDDWADETFTVYDHPRVMVYKKVE